LQRCQRRRTFGDHVPHGLKIGGIAQGAGDESGHELQGLQVRVVECIRLW
jgi:hypothetical protein